jgi:GDP-4-dehydro-6-deoxy-D-mannose reductase
MKKVLITGGAGFVGTHLKDLLENSISNLGSYSVEIFDVKYGQDIRSYEEIRNSIDTFQPDLIFHLAAQAFVPESSMNPNRGISVNLLGTLNLLEAVRQTGNHSKILVAGTSEEYGYDRDDLELTELSVAMPTTPYGVSKLASTTLAMTYARNYNMQIVATRAWNHIGPGASPSYAVSAFAKRIAEAEKYGTPVKHGNLESIRNYTNVRDTLAAYMFLIESPVGIYNVAGTDTVSSRYVMERLASFVRQDIKYEPNDNFFRPMSLKFPKPNVDKLIRTCGWTQSYTLDDTLEEILNYWRKVV